MEKYKKNMGNDEVLSDILRKRNKNKRIEIPKNDFSSDNKEIPDTIKVIYTNKIDTELREWTISIPIVTEANKTSLELLQTNYKNLYTFVYYDESTYHTVRLAKPFTFNQIATNTYSTTITLKESP